MSLLVSGTVALDNVETPFGRRENILGGSALMASYAASFFTPVQLVSVVGEDWPEEHTKMLLHNDIDTDGLEVKKGGKTFRWSGKYMENMNDRVTLETQLNVLADFDPKLPESFRRTQFLYLANSSPETQLKVLEQTQGASLTVADTMNFWIEIAKPKLLELLGKIDGLVLNDSEAKMLTNESNALTAGKKLLALGPRFVVVKKGEHGCMFVSEYETYLMPAYPTEKVVDPTGAGDTFAGAMMGYIASRGAVNGEVIKRALAYGTLVASFLVEGFSLERLQEITSEDIDARLEQFRKMVAF